jgi:Protein of unknown function (DUF3455)
MQKSVLRIHFSTPVLLGSLLALGLAAAACRSSSDTPAGATGDSGSGGGSNSSGGAHNTGGSKSSGGSIGTGGAKASGGSSGNGGSKATGGSSGSGGAATGGNGGTGGDGGPEACADPETLTVRANIPAIIQTPAGVTLVHHFHASGTQNYKCTGAPVVGDAGMTAYSWPFVGPEAILSDNCGKDIGTHFAPVVASSPQWQFTMDGSIVQGAKANPGSPVAGSIPELLLNATDHTGTGEFSDITFIQRLDTAGGAAPPVTDCTASNVNEVRKIHYTADYYFYTGPDDGGTP